MTDSPLVREQGPSEDQVTGHVPGLTPATDLMLRVSHPRTAVSFAVATWVQL